VDQMPKRTPSEQLDLAVERLLGRADQPGSRGEAGRPFDARFAPVMEVVSALRDLPRGDFKARLRAELHRRATMATSAKSMSQVSQAAVSYLAVRDASAAIEFYKKAFGAIETLRLTDPSGKIAHAEISIGNSSMYLAEEMPGWQNPSPDTLGGSAVTIVLNVADVDSVVRQAVEAGAKLLAPVMDQFYGERSGKLTDPFGHVWRVSTRIEDLSNEEMRRRFDALMSQAGQTASPAVPIREGFHSVTPYLIVSGAGQLVEFMKEAFGAQERFRVNRPGGQTIMHTEVEIGDSIIELSDGSAEFPPAPVTLLLRVSDVDAVYNRAIEAGATPFQPVTDHDYGSRGGSVKDLCGNTWHVFTPVAGDTIFKDFRSVTPHLNPLRAARMIEFFEEAFGAQEVYRAQSPDGVIHHAQVRIGDSLIGMSDAHGPYQPTACTLHVYVSDADAAYERALRAGATPIQPVADQPYGERNGGVQDPFGNRWFLATPIQAPPVPGQPQ
jgi:PhnB protein